MISKKLYEEMPKAYREGFIEFYKLKFKVTPNVLIPRPETELLVEEVITYAKADQSKHPITVIDVGTGSGCIGISIAKNTQNTRILATEISPEALDVAKFNAKFHKVDKKIFFIESDLLTFLNNHKDVRSNTFMKGPEVIVANLPYLPTGRISALDVSVIEFEPYIALNGGFDGFDLYRKLFQQISLQPERWMPKLMVFEIDYSQGDLAKDEAFKYFPKAQIEIKHDLAKKQRILVIKSSFNL